MENSIVRIFAVAKILMPAFEEINRSVLGGRQGMCLAILPRWRDDALIISELIGKLHPDKVEEEKCLAIEKINRMRANHEDCSFQSENEDILRFGGGIKTNNFFIATGGFPPHLGQSFVLMLALMTEEMSYEECAAVMNLSLSNVNKWRKRNGQQAIYG